MVFNIHSFQTTKIGYKPEECQDAFSFDPQRRLFAIADGATDSAFQRLWAKLLVRGFVTDPPDFSKPSSVEVWLGGWLKSLQEEWNKNIPWDTLSASGYNKSKLTGGLATFLGLHFFPKKPIWTSIAFGDCNVFQLRGRNKRDYHLLFRAPIINSKDFGVNPIALSSIRPNPGMIYQHMVSSIGDYIEGDFFFLATDALACWFLAEFEKNLIPIPKNTKQTFLSKWLFPSREKKEKTPLEQVSQPWEALLNLKTHEDFECLINQLRNEKKIKNDDTTLLIIEILDAPEKTLRMKTRDSKGISHVSDAHG